jgi:hypothetical protein
LIRYLGHNNALSTTSRLGFCQGHRVLNKNLNLASSIVKHDHIDVDAAREDAKTPQFAATNAKTLSGFFLLELLYGTVRLWSEFGKDMLRSNV